MSDGERTFRVEVMTRVEGEGSFTLRVKDGVVVEAQLAIFEAPRFFEAFLRGRSPGRGRHRRAHLRHLPRRLPDERVDARSSARPA